MSEIAGIWEHITWPAVGIFISLLGILIGAVYRFARIDIDLKDLNGAVNGINETIELFHGKCDSVTEKLIKAVTRDMLTDHCSESQSKCTSSICRKIDGVHIRLKEQSEATKALEKRVDHNQEVISKQLTEIIRSLGRLEGKRDG